MITTLKKFETNTPYYPIETDVYSNGFFYGRKMMILESNWEEEDSFNTISVYPFLSNIGNVLGNKFRIEVGHRHFDSVRGLKFYLQYPSGKIWSDPNCFGISVFYIAAHGGTASIRPTLEIIRRDGLIGSLKGGFETYPCILFISGCGVFGGEEGNNFGMDLLGSSGARAVLGYESSEIGFLHSLMIDMLFLSKFFGIEYEDPFTRLKDIFDFTVENFKPAKDMGFKMFLR